METDVSRLSADLILGVDECATGGLEDLRRALERAFATGDEGTRERSEPVRGGSTGEMPADGGQDFPSARAVSSVSLMANRLMAQQDDIQSAGSALVTLDAVLGQMDAFLEVSPIDIIWRGAEGERRAFDRSDLEGIRSELTFTLQRIRQMSELARLSVESGVAVPQLSALSADAASYTDEVERELGLLVRTLEGLPERGLATLARFVCAQIESSPELFRSAFPAPGARPKGPILPPERGTTQDHCVPEGGPLFRSDDLEVRVAGNSYWFRDLEMKRVLQLIMKKLARTDGVVMIYGETGSGKEIAARAVHDYSRRRDASYVAVNCGGVRDELLMSELFGSCRGGFTGAVNRIGRMKEAHKGTFFMDELEDISKEMQKQLLRVLSDGRVRPVGGSGQDEYMLDVRYVTASNQPLEPAVQQGSFRSDLYYRLNEFNVELPPLRKRPADIELLVPLFLREFREEMPHRVSPGAMALLISHEWPGNVRELRMVLKRLAVYSDGPLIQEEMIIRELGVRPRPLEPPVPPVDGFLTTEERRLLAERRMRQSRDTASERKERVVLCKALRVANWDVDGAAELLSGQSGHEGTAYFRGRLCRFLKGLRDQLGEAGDQAGRGQVASKTGLEALKAALERQYRTDRFHVLRVLDALKDGQVRGVELSALS